jgi:DNA-binding beta-propeller fold protein YncE
MATPNAPYPLAVNPAGTRVYMTHCSYNDGQYRAKQASQLD